VDERTTEILAECKGIIEAIEHRKLPLSRIALRARRLAQLLDDDEAFMWLSMECVGADGGTPPARQWSDQTGANGSKGLQKYLKLHAVRDFTNVTIERVVDEIAKGRLVDKTRVAGAPLAELEAGREPLSKDVSEQLSAVRGGPDLLLHFRQIAGNIFDRFKTNADAVLAQLCPDAIAKLTNAVEKAGSDKPEDWAAAALSCRRVLHDFADAVYPPRDEPVEGRSVAKDKYKNRLWAFAKDRGSKAVEKEFLATEEIDALCKTLDRVYELDSKGVHDAVTNQQAHLAVLRTYILLEQLAQLVPA
jgi:hypothetical protein